MALADEAGPGDSIGIIAALRAWSAQVVRFTRDPVDVELLHSPGWMLGELSLRGVIAVDCDDAAVLVAAVAGSVGVRCRFVAGALGRKLPYSHVWAECENGHSWELVDPTAPVQGIGSLDSPQWARILVLEV